MRKAGFKRIATQRIRELFNQADAVFSSNPALANRYVQLARKIAMRFKIRLAKKYKRKFCKHCYTYLAGANSRIRIQNRKVVIFCVSCKKFTRIPIGVRKSKN